MPPTLSYATQSSSPSTGPRVSIAMVTYNHEKFVSQAIESVMAQETTFPCELVIGEDCSCDRTREIVLGFQRKFPDRIRVLLHEKNVGMIANFGQTLRACQGAYIALLEGDDFWSSSHKLQKQVEFLEANPQCSACFALARVVAEGNSSEEFYTPSRQTKKLAFTTEDLIAKNSIATASVMYRNVMPEINFESLNHLKMIDWPLHILVSVRGPIGFIPEEMAVYRQHPGGVWTGIRELARLTAVLRMYQTMGPLLPANFGHRITTMIVKYHQLIALEHLRLGKRRASFSSTWRSLLAIPWQSAPAYSWYLKRSAILFLGVLGFAPGGVERLLAK